VATPNPTFDRVVAATGADPVVAGPADDVVDAGARDDHVGVAGAVDRASADDRGGLAETLRRLR
jgi:hypothetical protein